MIYRIVAESVRWVDDNGEMRQEGTGNHLRGVFRAGFSDGFGDLKLVWIDHPRARFYFTEAGWAEYGQRVAAAAQQQGITIRVLRAKNPARSQIVYQDRFQIVVLPSRNN